MKKRALEEVPIDTWLTLTPIKGDKDLPALFRLEADGAYIDHGGKLRIKFKHTKQYSQFDDALAENEVSPLVEYDFNLGDKRYKGEGNAVLYMDEVILKDMRKSDMSKIMKSAKVAQAITALQQTIDNWRGEGCKNYDDSQDICLDDVKTASPPESDGRIDAIADYMVNSLEHDPDEKDAIYHLQQEFGLRHEVAKKLINEWYKHKMQLDITAPAAKVHKFISDIVHKQASDAAWKIDHDKARALILSHNPQGHGTVYCSCGRMISTCRCASFVKTPETHGPWYMDSCSKCAEFKFAEYIQNPHVRTSFVNLRISDLMMEYKRLGEGVDAAKKIAEKYKVDPGALAKIISVAPDFKDPKTASLVEAVSNLCEIYNKVGGGDKIKYNDKLFGQLLKPGDKVTIQNLITGKTSNPETVDRFDGIEYHFKDKPDPKERLGHSGFSVESPKSFLVYMNREPHLRVTKTAAGMEDAQKETGASKDDVALVVIRRSGSGANWHYTLSAENPQHQSLPADAFEPHLSNLLKKKFEYSDDAHDAAQKAFPHAKVTVLS